MDLLSTSGRSLRQALLTLGFVGVALALTACSGDKTAPQVRTGILALDEAIEAVRERDEETLARLVVLQSEPCGSDALPCLGGETAGTPVEVLQAASCQGYLLRRDDVANAAERFMGGEPELYAVYRNSGLVFAGGEYTVLFTYRDGLSPAVVPARQLVISRDGIVAINFGCSQTPRELIELQGLQDPIFGPRDSALVR